MIDKFLVLTTLLMFYTHCSGAAKSTIRTKLKKYDIDAPANLFDIKPGKPVPRAQELHRMITKYLFERPDFLDGSAVINYLQGENPALDKRLLNITVLDPKTVKKMVNIAQEKDKKRIEADPAILNGRRFAHELLAMTGKVFTDDDIKKSERKVKEKLVKTRRGRDGEDNFILYETNKQAWKEFVRSLMLQSIYQTRMDLHRTRIFRRRYRYNHSFQIATLYASVVECLKKIRELHTTCTRFWRREWQDVKFLFYLVAYEKALAAYTDISFYTREIYVIQKYFEAHLANFFIANAMMN